MTRATVRLELVLNEQNNRRKICVTIRPFAKLIRKFVFAEENRMKEIPRGSRMIMVGALVTAQCGVR
jgi:hypothetical protein